MSLRSLFAALLFIAVTAVTAAAQSDSQAPDFEAWDTVAARAERILEFDRATSQTLLNQRNALTGWREQFLAAQSINDARIQTVGRQLAVLGAPPAEGETETEWLTERRGALNTELDRLREPSLRAAEAFARVDGLIREIDGALRDRKAREVFSRSAISLDIRTWTAPLEELNTTVFEIPREVFRNLSDTRRWQEIRDKLPSSVALTVLGIVILLRHRFWIRGVRKWSSGIRQPLASYLVRAVVLVIEIALPWSGLVALAGALTVSGLFGPTGTALLFALSRFGLDLIVGAAFVRRMFPTAPNDESRVWFTQDQWQRGKALAIPMVVLLSLIQGLTVFANRTYFTDAAKDLVMTPILLALAYLLFRMSRLVLRSFKAADTVDDEITLIVRLLTILFQLVRITAVVSSLAILTGFIPYGEATIIPAAYTIFLMGFVALVRNAVQDADAMVRRRPRNEGDLISTLLSIAVVIAALPVFALIWGARVTDLTELWAKLKEGVSLGEVTISPSDLLTFFAVFMIALLATRLLQLALRTVILPKTRLDQGARVALVSGIGYIGVTLAAFLAIRGTGLDLSSVAIVAGALSVGIGFGLQTIVSNFVSGIILLIERPISEGDWIDVAGNQGYVRSISVRSTRIETFDRTDVIVPNSDLVSGTVTNWTRGNLVGRLILPVGVAYGTDTARVEKLLRDVAEAHPMVLISPPPAVLFMGFGADSLDFEIRAILRDVNFIMSVRSDMNHEIARVFRQENIEIPFAQRDIWLRNPETLKEREADPVDAQPRPPAKRDTSGEMPIDVDGDGGGEGDNY